MFKQVLQRRRTDHNYSVEIAFRLNVVCRPNSHDLIILVNKLKNSADVGYAADVTDRKRGEGAHGRRHLDFEGESSIIEIDRIEA